MNAPYRIKTAGGTLLPTIFRTESDARNFLFIYRVKGFIIKVN
jgi:hypothetical protein